MNMRSRDNSKPPSGPSPSRLYYEKYLASEAWEEGSGEAIFIGFLESLNICDWHELIADLIQQQPEARDVFRPHLGENLLTHAAVFLNRLGPATLRLMREAISRLVSGYSTPNTISSQQLVELLSFCRLLHNGCEPVVLANLVADSSTDMQIRLLSAQILSNQPLGLPLDFWQGLDLESAPELLSVVISAIAEYSPILALDTLAKQRRPPVEKSLLEYPLRLVIRQLARSASGLAQLSDTMRDLPQWAQREIRKILLLPEFTTISSEVIPDPTKKVDISRDIDNYLAGKITLAELKLEGESDPLIEEVLSAWQPLKTGGMHRSLRLIKLVRHFPSLTSIRISIFALDEILRKPSTEGATLAQSALTIAREILQLLAENLLMIARVRSEKTTQSRELIAHYGRALQIALRFKELAPIAFDQIVSYAQDRAIVIAATRTAIRQGRMTPQECDQVLRSFYDPETSAEFIQSTLFGIDRIPRLLGAEEVLSLGAQIYKFNPSLIFNKGINITEEDRLLIQDVAVPPSFAEMAAQFVSEEVI